MKQKMSEEMKNSSGGQFERYDPQHPLPPEVNNMERDETVCQYCGVSYLIHSEIKKLEERTLAAEAELKHYKGAMDREKQVREELEKAKKEINDLKEKCRAKDNVYVFDNFIFSHIVQSMYSTVKLTQHKKL